MLRTIIFSIILFSAATNVISAQKPQLIQFFSFDNLILIPSFAEGKEGYLILDSGAEGLALNKKYFDDDQNVDENLTARGFNGRVNEVLVRKTNLRISHHLWNDLKALVIDLEHLKPAKDLPIIGLIGFQIFGDYEVLLDFKTSSLILFNLDERGNVKASNYHQTPYDVSFPFKFKGHIPSIEINIEGLTLRMGIDTGSGIHLIHPKYKSELNSHLESVKNIQLQGTDQKNKQATLWKLHNINVSMLSFPPMGVAFTNINSFNSMLWGAKLDGVLGSNFLRQFMTSINFKKKEMHIWLGSSAAAFQ